MRGVHYARFRTSIRVHARCVYARFNHLVKRLGVLLKTGVREREGTTAGFIRITDEKGPSALIKKWVATDVNWGI